MTNRRSEEIMKVLHTYRNVITLVAAAVVTVVAGIAVMYGVLTHDEATFDEQAAPWAQVDIPLSVTCEGHTQESNERCSVIDRLVGDINSRVGFEILTIYLEMDIPGKVHYRLGVPQNVLSTIRVDGQDSEGNLYHAGENTALWSHNGRATYCEVRTSNTGDDTTLWVVAYHGTGHCLGLAHDPSDYRRSIMRELQPASLDAYRPDSLPQFTDSDVRALRTRYLLPTLSSVRSITTNIF